jgi:hypothetical protein
VHLYGQVAGQAERLQLLVDAVKPELVVVQQQQLARLFSHNLPAQLTADAAAGPAHQHYFTGQVAGQ